MGFAESLSASVAVVCHRFAKTRPRVTTLSAICHFIDGALASGNEHFLKT
jgi:hypothetical protein